MILLPCAVADVNAAAPIPRRFAGAAALAQDARLPDNGTARPPEKGILSNQRPVTNGFSGGTWGWRMVKHDWTAGLDEAVAELKDIVGPRHVTVDPKRLAAGSRDCFHFSPVLIPQLEDKRADVIVLPGTQDELRRVVGVAARHGAPLTPRGAGTGNYGQGVPLHGGMLVNTKRLNRIIHLDAGAAQVEAGVILHDIEKAAATVDAELRMFPSTVPTSSAAGFVTGGSGGVGSIEWGLLRERGNVPAVDIFTVEPSPRRERVAGANLEGVLHNCGLTAFVVEVTLALAPKTPWHQYAIAFEDLTTCLTAGRELAENDAIKKRLVTAFEWPIPSFFVPLMRRGICPEGAHALFLYTDAPPAVVEPLARGLGGRVTFHDQPRPPAPRGAQLYDYTWNHTTQWAMKADASLTYLQDRFDIDRMHEQMEARRRRFPNEVFEHVEFIKVDGRVAAAGLSIVAFKSPERLAELIAYCESDAIRVSNPHTYFLDDDTRWYGDAFLTAKKRWDPAGLLNPGHLRAMDAA